MFWLAHILFWIVQLLYDQIPQAYPKQATLFHGANGCYPLDLLVPYYPGYGRQLLRTGTGGQ